MAGHSPTSFFYPYDHRFYSAFVAELAQRNHPHFPDPPWHMALLVADRLAPCREPLPDLKPPRSQDKTQLTTGLAHWTESDYGWRSRLSLACSRWLERYSPSFK